MASGKDKMAKSQLLCSFCSDYFKEPKILDCLHSFCKNCLQELACTQDRRGPTFKCPICSGATAIPQGVEELADDLTMCALVEEFLMQEQLLGGQKMKIKCQSCEEKGPAVSWCTNCDHFLCMECEQAHHRLSLLRAHIIHPLGQLQSGEVIYERKLRNDVPKCRQHPDENLNIFCESCQKLACAACSVLEHTQHSLFDLRRAADKCKEDIKRLSAKAKENMRTFGNVSVTVNHARKNLDVTVGNIKQKISQKAQGMIDKIRIEEERLKQEVDRIHEDRGNTFHAAQMSNQREMACAKHKLQQVDRFLEHASCHSILDTRSKLL
ncbi:E3 ubiquitin-protein ligase TRIM33-like [Acanthaster planci]|uniref:E3 ubiquitin-protein ligase TRIM33-like n=1 Tax=Acanthaster planci TaxID=133434 RepID=A0A8B7ZDV6_ACAPL|nr:E3 ubiquitin-protein ligase TRIM33-like [Acanthaster planci]